MNPSWETMTVAIALVVTIAAYALFVGADFGGGIWDLLAGGSERGAAAREAIDESVTPVWEGNQTWIVLGLVLLWTGFPSVFSAVMTALFVPLALSLLGLVLRGVGFAFRHEAESLAARRLTGFVFAASSVLAPFFLGASLGAVATGKVPADPHGNVPGAWLTPTALMTGALFVCTCAYIGAVYLVGDTHRRGDEAMVRYFSRRAIAAGVVTGILAAVNLGLLHSSAARLFHRLFGAALPVVIVSVVGGLAALVLVLLRRTWALRLSAGLAVAGVVAAWAWAQYPYVLPDAVTLQSAAAPSSSLLAEVVVIAMAAVLVVPSFAYLYWLQQHGQLSRHTDSQALRARVVQQSSGEAAADSAAAASPHPHPVVIAVTVGAGVIELLRDRRERRRRRSGSDT